MKRIIILIAIFFCYFFVDAQQAPKKAPTKDADNNFLHFGLSIAPTVDWFAPNSEGLTRAKVKGGFFTGINLDVNVLKRRLYFSTGILVRYLQGELAFINSYNFPEDTVSILPTVRTYQSSYLVIPTGIKLRTKPSRNCVFNISAGFYHQFKVGGWQEDNFTYGNNPGFYITTERAMNNHAALFTEAAYGGLGFEYAFSDKLRVYTNVNYGCQFNYFSAETANNVTGEQFKSIIHSLYIVFGFMF